MTAVYTPTSVMYADMDFKGTVRFTGDVTVPANSISTTSIDTSIPFTASATQHQFSAHMAEAANAGTAPTEVIHIAKESGTVVAFDVAAQTVPTGGDSVVVDLQKSTAGGAFATILSATITLDVASVDRVAESASLAAGATMIAGDLLRVVMTGTGSTGTGFIGRAKITENPT